MIEVIRIRINIVGIVSDADELEEIMDMTEIFAIEKRMMDLKHLINPKDLIKKTCLKTTKKFSKIFNYNHNNLKILTVHGLN